MLNSGGYRSAELNRKVGGLSVSYHCATPTRCAADIQVPGLALAEFFQWLCWAKAAELVKVARSDGQEFDCATWLHRAQALSKEQFKFEVEKHLTGKETEPWEIIYFKVYKSQLPVIEQALETAALVLGSDKSRGYCLEMICADFMAGANVGNGNPNVLFSSFCRLYEFFLHEQRLEFLKEASRPL